MLQGREQTPLEKAGLRRVLGDAQDDPLTPAILEVLRWYRLSRVVHGETRAAARAECFRLLAEVYRAQGRDLASFRCLVLSAAKSGDELRHARRVIDEARSLDAARDGLREALAAAQGGRPWRPS